MREFSRGACEPRYRRPVAQNWPKLPTADRGPEFQLHGRGLRLPRRTGGVTFSDWDCVMYGKLMLPDVLLPKLLDGYPATFERSEGLNDFVVRVNGADRTISREAWRSLLDLTRSAVDQPRVAA
jgi:hypothetical protein